jgi:Uncharacterized protein conserved in bacteria (DUF2325)
MRIGIVGGVDRSATALHEAAEAQGHALEIHDGVMSSGAAAASLRALIARAELVVVVTDVNSHNGVRAARRAAKHLGRTLRIVRRMGTAQLAVLLRDLPKRAA